MDRALRLAAIAAAVTLAGAAAVAPAEASQFPGPRIERVSAGPRYLPKFTFVPMAASYPEQFHTYVLRFAGSSTAVAYESERRSWTGGRGDSWEWSGPTEWSATTSTTRRIDGGTDCFRVRARDAYGHVGPWSSSACVSVPRRGDDMYPSSCGITDAAYRHNRSETCDYDTVRTWFASRGSKVRISYWSGPHTGSFDVYVGSTKLGHVRATSTRTTLRHVTFSVGHRTTGHLKLRGTSGRVQIDDWIFLP